ncbi:MAG: LytTR family DNA-binding domain-containing protein [Bacteroidota bacterium]
MPIFRIGMRKWLNNRFFFHLVALLALLLVHGLADYEHMQQRTGFNRYSPYLFLLLLYGWIVFHNLVLFDGLYLRGKKRAYFRWTALAVVICLANMTFVLVYIFQIANPLPQILNFWLYTLLGLGVYMTYRYLKETPKKLVEPSDAGKDNSVAEYFTFTADGQAYQLPLEAILYLESLENYVKIHTQQKTYVARLPLKEAEQRLPNPLFIRVSRSHILNTSHIHAREPDTLKIGEQRFKIGKVYKKYVEDQLTL